MVSTASPAAPPLFRATTDDGLHVCLDRLEVRQFVLCAEAQQVLCAMTEILVAAPYKSFGKTAESEAHDRFNVVFPKTFGSDRRKPVTPEFQGFSEELFWPLLNALLFGNRGWSEVRRHLTSVKLNSLRISEDEPYYNRPIYHFHLDHKIGQREPKDENQQRTMRMIFSTVPAALRRESGGGDEGENGGPRARWRAVDAPHFDSTVYLRVQPSRGFHSYDELHRYLSTRFPERGLSAQRERPLYEVDDSELYRARPGEVLTHHSHPGSPVHAETNPCPEGRCLYVLDWSDRRNLVYEDEPPPGPPQELPGAGSGLAESTGATSGDGGDGERRSVRAKPRARKVAKVLPCSRIPKHAILDLMRVLADGTTHAFAQRLSEVTATGRSLLAEVAPSQRTGCAAVERFLEDLLRNHPGADTQPQTETRPTLGDAA